MKAIINTLLTILYITAFAQGDNVFTVKKETGKMQLIPNLDTLTAGRKYAFICLGAKPIKIARITAEKGAGGKKGDSIIFRANPTTEPGTCKLNVFIADDNSTEPYFTREFVVIPPVDRSSIIMPVKPRGYPITIYSWDRTFISEDSVPLINIRYSDFIGAVNYSTPGVTYDIISFKVEVHCGKDSKDYFAKGDKYSDEMKQAFEKVEPGCFLILHDIKYKARNASPDVMVTGPYKMHVKETRRN